MRGEGYLTLARQTPQKEKKNKKKLFTSLTPGERDCLLFLFPQIFSESEKGEGKGHVDYYPTNKARVDLVLGPEQVLKE